MTPYEKAMLNELKALRKEIRDLNKMIANPSTLDFNNVDEMTDWTPSPEDIPDGLTEMINGIRVKHYE